MKTMPVAITLAKEEADQFAKIKRDQLSIQQFVQMMTQEGQRRVEAAIVEQQKLWAAMAQKYGIDVKSIRWELNSDGSQIVPTQMAL